MHIDTLLPSQVIDQVFSVGKRIFKISRSRELNSNNGRSLSPLQLPHSVTRSHAAFVGVGVVWYRVCLVAR